MSERWPRYLLLLPAAGALAIFLVLHAARGELLSDSGDVLVALMYFGIGGVPYGIGARNRAASRLVAITSLVVIGFTIAYALARGGGWPVVVTLQTFSWTIPCAVLALFAVFPDGAYQRTYERAIVVAAFVIGAMLQVVQIAGSEMVSTQQFVATQLRASNPLFVTSLRPLGPVATSLLGYFQFSIVIALALLILRYRRSRSELRRQIRWPLFGIAVTFGAVNLLFFLPTSNGPENLIDGIIYFGLLVLVPVPLAIGILNPPWLDVDLVIRRSVVYGVLWLLIAASYVGVATIVGIALGQRVPLELAILLTIAATLVFQPARQWLEKLGDRLIFGHRLGGYQMISRLGTRLESSAGAEDVAGTVAAIVQSGLGARWVRVDLNRPEPTAVAIAGVGPAYGAEAVLTAPLVHADQVVGRIDCGPKIQGAYSSADQELLTTLGRQAALSIRNSQLSAELSERLEELAASRKRLVKADDAARRRLERDLHDGVQQQLVGLLARLGLARNQIRRDSELASATLREAQFDAQRALESVQEVARGIHPAVLTDRGLVEAVRERATRMTIPVEVTADGLVAGARFGSDLEGAAYFFVGEALANVLKHAQASRVEVHIACDGDRLLIEVSDDGRETLGGRMDFDEPTRERNDPADGRADIPASQCLIAYVS